MKPFKSLQEIDSNGVQFLEYFKNLMVLRPKSVQLTRETLEVQVAGPKHLSKYSMPFDKSTNLSKYSSQF